MQELLDYRQSLLARCVTVGDDLRRAAAALPPDRWHTPIQSGGLTPHQALARLHARATLLIQPALAILLKDGDEPLPVFVAQAWLENDYRPSESWQSLLEATLAAYTIILKQLHDLPPGGWSLAARHPSQGRRTLQWWLEQGLRFAEEALVAISG